MLETTTDSENKSDANQKFPDGTSKIRVFMEQLDDYLQAEISLNDVSVIVEALTKFYGMFDLRNDVIIKRIISHISNQLNAQ
ncbi:KAP P-loop domain-containing protein [Tolypothrix tenuis PCC 7101]|uniref:KAP P-loop domain-containing protein n=1 Tax=Tolypothrix tenuis PCC 7101 TaxID=231146 RepID=A0A1Z4NAB5_9CYAN|nr:hypothetical protein [Aulosira sp. FACHB-113]BAZ02650.1 KAP P-loop domain-containing protein [Tolypothrix tenuis PCC 7101]BAZ73429.1 KAP P-loop domain-containing protein [Aulosira laxa NIES-50]